MQRLRGVRRSPWIAELHSALWRFHRWEERKVKGAECNSAIQMNVRMCCPQRQFPAVNTGGTSSTASAKM